MNTPHPRAAYLAGGGAIAETGWGDPGAAIAKETAGGEGVGGGLAAGNGVEVVLGERSPEGLGVGVAEVALGEVGGGGDFDGGSGVEDGDLVGDLEGGFNVVGDEDNAFAFVGELAQVVEGFFDRVGVESWCGFIGNQQIGLADDGGRHQDSARHAAGNLKRIGLLDRGGKAIAVEGLIDQGLGGGFGQAAELGNPSDLVTHLHQGIKVGDRLGNQGNFFAA